MIGIGKLIPYLPILFVFFGTFLELILNIFNPHLLAGKISSTAFTLYNGLLLKKVSSGLFGAYSADNQVIYILMDIILIILWILCMIVGSKRNNLGSLLMFIFSIALSYTCLLNSINLII